jgi:hypothetical protein
MYLLQYFLRSIFFLGCNVLSKYLPGYAVNDDYINVSNGQLFFFKKYSTVYGYQI